MLTLKETNHQYYCDHYDEETYSSFQEFKEAWVGGELSTIDNDYNLVFRYDLEKMLDDDTSQWTGGYELRMNYMLQRKGKHVKVIIQNITEEDLKEINPYLKQNYEYLQGIWCEFSSK